MRLLATVGAGGTLGAGVAVLGLLVLGGAAFAQTAQPKAMAAPAQAAKPAAPAVPNWVVNCVSAKEGLDCRASQTVPLDPTGRANLALAVRISADTKKPVLLFQTPMGIYLPAGLTVQFGQDTAKAVPFQTCGTPGCIAEYPVSGAELAGMQSGTEITVSVQDLNKRVLKVRIPMTGFSAAFAKIK